MCAERRNPDPVIPSRVEDEPPPFCRSWNCIYAAVLVYVLVLVLLLYWMTVALND